MTKEGKKQAYRAPEADIRMPEADIFTSETVQILSCDAGDECSWQIFFE